MQNVVPCKECNTEFEYSPGFAGNTPQMCNPCRQLEAERELEREKEASILEGNKYLVNAPDYKNRFDVTDILIEGILPDFTDQGEKFACTMEVALFLRTKHKLMNCEENIAKFMEYLGEPHVTLFIKQLTLPQMECMAKHVAFKDIMKQMVKNATSY